MSYFKKLKEAFSKKDQELYTTGLSNTKRSFGDNLKRMFLGDPEFDDAWYDHVLALLLQADVSLGTAQKIMKSFRKQMKHKTSLDEAWALFLQTIENQYGENVAPYAIEKGRLNTILMVGVNGSGKTTTSAKLASQLHDLGYKVLLVGGDTFRAAGSSQLGQWAQRIGVEFMGGEPNQDPSSVFVDAARFAKAHDIDVMICDSAGRLQNKTNLMNELEKMKRVLVKEAGSVDHTYLVIDGNTGQNGLQQAKIFTEVTPVDSLIVTKLDGSPKGGVLLSIQDELGIKASHIGLGEGVEDLKVFEIQPFIASMVDIDEL